MCSSNISIMLQVNGSVNANNSNFMVAVFGNLVKNMMTFKINLSGFFQLLAKKEFDMDIKDIKASGLPVKVKVRRCLTPAPE